MKASAVSVRVDERDFRLEQLLAVFPVDDWSHLAMLDLPKYAWWSIDHSSSSASSREDEVISFISESANQDPTSRTYQFSSDSIREFADSLCIQRNLLLFFRGKPSPKTVIALLHEYDGISIEFIGSDSSVKNVLRTIGGSETSSRDFTADDLDCSDWVKECMAAFLP